jgi:hypothetical protein
VPSFAELVLCPALVNTKYADVEVTPDGSTDVCLYHRIDPQ